jgi:hypothetical protein
MLEKSTRGDDQQQDGMFSYISPNKRVPQDHPLRRIRSIADRVLGQLSPRFNKLYARAGRPSIAPEKLRQIRDQADHRISHEESRTVFNRDFSAPC